MPIMRNTAGALSLLALARLVAATDCGGSSPCQASVDAVPGCATSCIQSAAVTQASCGLTDYRCQCDHNSVIQNAALNCVVGACGFGEALSVLPSISSLCACVTAHPTTPCTASVTTTSQAPPTTTSPPTTSSPPPPPPPPTTTSTSTTMSALPPPPTTTTSSTTSSVYAPPPPPVTTTTTTTTSPVTSVPPPPPPSSCDSTSPCQASVNAVPGCATSCIQSAAVTQASCGLTDYQCQCDQDTVIQNAALNCVIGACGFGEALSVLPSISSLCACVTAHPTTPCTASATTTSQVPPPPPTTTSTSALPPPPTTTTTTTTTSVYSPPPVTTTTTTTGPVTSAPPPPNSCDSTSPCQASVDAVPSCATSCIQSAAVTQASCGLTDYKCQCDQDTVIQNAALNCVVGACGFGEALSVLPSISSLCACVTAHPTTPCTASATTTSQAPPTTTSASTTTSSSTTSAPPVTSTTFSTSTTQPPTTTTTSTSYPPPVTTTTSGPVTSASCVASSPCQASVDAVPSCATSCIQSAAVTQASCGLTDYRCQCDQDTVIQNAALNCVVGACGFGEALSVLPSISSLCVCVTAHPTTPCTASATTTSQTPPPTTTTPPPTTTTLPTTSQSSTSTPPPTSTSTTSSAPPPPPTTTTATTSTPVTTTTTGPITSASCDLTSPCQASVNAVPGCATSCIQSAAVTQASCGVTDYRCQCDQDTVIQNAALNCVIGACGFGEALSVLPSISSLCACVTAHPTTPCTATATTTSHAPPPTTSSSLTSTSQSTTSTPPTTSTSTTSSAPPPPTTTTTTTSTPVTTTTTGSITSASCDSNSPCQASVNAVPGCATSCIQSAAVTQASCGVTDYRCQCDQDSVIQNAALNCVVGACGFGEALSVLPSISSLCACVTAHPTTPCGSAPTSTTSESITTSTTVNTPPTSTAPTSVSTSASTTVSSESTTSVSPTTKTSTSTGPITTGPSSCDSTSPCQASAEAVPRCATSCINSAASALSCSFGDYECQCSKASDIQNAALNCVVGDCGLGTALNVLPAVSSLCGCVTAHPTTPCTTAPATTTTSSVVVNTSSSASGTSEKPPTSTKSTSSPSQTSLSKTSCKSSSGPATTSKPSTTCRPGTTSDCGPVASTAVPSCAQACFTSAAPKIPCDVHDYACQCQPAAQQSLTQLLIPCVATACPPASIPAVIAGAGSVCACATAPPAPGDCTTVGPGSSQPTVTSTSNAPPPVTTTTCSKSGSSGKPASSSTCKPGTTQDCGPVASSAVPSCAQACFSSAAPVAGCDVHDYACQCQPDIQVSLTSLLVPCVATACPPASLPAVIGGANSVCACASAKPTGGSCATSTPPGNSNTSRGGPTNTGNGYPTQTSGNGPTQTGSSGSPTTCAPLTKDCGAVATSAVPACAQACFTSAAPKIPCDVHDYACQCQPAAQASLTQLLVPCVATACPAASVPAVIAGAGSVCACATAPPAGGNCGGSTPTSGNSGQPTGGNGGQPSGGNGGYPAGGNGGGQPSGGSGSEPSGGNGSQPTGTSGGSGGDNGGSGGNGGNSGSGGNGGDSGGNGGSSGGNGGNGGPGNHGGSNGGSGNGNGANGGSTSQPTTTAPPVVAPGAGSRLEIGAAAGVAAVVWLVAFAA